MNNMAAAIWARNQTTAYSFFSKCGLYDIAEKKDENPDPFRCYSWRHAIGWYVYAIRSGKGGNGGLSARRNVSTGR